jgi:hypothetical protein
MHAEAPPNRYVYDHTELLAEELHYLFGPLAHFETQQEEDRSPGRFTRLNCPGAGHDLCCAR